MIEGNICVRSNTCINISLNPFDEVVEFVAGAKDASVDIIAYDREIRGNYQQYAIYEYLDTWLSFDVVKKDNTQWFSHGFDDLRRVTQMFAGLESLLQLSNFVDEDFLLVSFQWPHFVPYLVIL